MHLKSFIVSWSKNKKVGETLHPLSKYRAWFTLSLFLLLNFQLFHLELPSNAKSSNYSVLHCENLAHCLHFWLGVKYTAGTNRISATSFFTLPFVQLFASRLSSHLSISSGYPLLISRARSLRLQSTKSHDGIALAQYSFRRPSPYQSSSILTSTIDLSVAGYILLLSPLSHTLELYPYVYNRPIGRWLLLSPLPFVQLFRPLPRPSLFFGSPVAGAGFRRGAELLLFLSL